MNGILKTFIFLLTVLLIGSHLDARPVEHVPVLMREKTENCSLVFTQIFFHVDEHGAELLQAKNQLLQVTKTEL